MQCLRPLYAVDYHHTKSNGKKSIRIIPKTELAKFKTYDDLVGYYGRDNLIKLPCGKCLACKKNYAQQWAVRCALEAKDYDKNIFLTLTYTDEFLPDNDDDLKKDFQKFIKALRNAGYKFRYFGCGEHGDLSDRRHLHIILFGYFPEDYKYVCKTAQGGYYYSSNFLTSLWRKGHIVICDFTFATAKYVASYCVKGAGSKKTSFVLMSKKPGIGFKYLKENYLDIYKDDLIYGNFGNNHTAHPPRSFDEYVKDKLNLDISPILEKRKVLGEHLDADKRAVTRSIYQHNLEAFNERALSKKVKKRRL